MSEKTMADVADKTVDKLDQFAQAVAKVAPDAWDTMVLAERIDGATSIVIWLVMVAGSLFALRQAQRALAEDDSDSPRFVFGIVIGCIGTAICVISLLCASGDTLQQLWVPEYTAAKGLLEAVK